MCACVVKQAWQLFDEALNYTESSGSGAHENDTVTAEVRAEIAKPLSGSTITADAVACRYCSRRRLSRRSN